MDNRTRFHKSGITQLRFQQKEIVIEKGPRSVTIISRIVMWLDHCYGLPIDPVLASPFQSIMLRNNVAALVSRSELVAR